MAWTCAVTGDESEGKHYVLKTTEGEELVSPDAFLNPVKFLHKAARDLGEMEVRLKRLEDLLQDQEDGGKVAQAAKKAAAPVKRTRARDQSS